MVLQAVMWVIVAALVVYGVATLLASIKLVQEGQVGIATTRGGSRRPLPKGLHIVNPFTTRVRTYPGGSHRLEGDVRGAITQDGWRLSAHVELNARLRDELAVVEAGGDWRKATQDAVVRILRTEIENNEATDLKPRPQALDDLVLDEVNALVVRWGVEVDWLRVTIRWAESLPPAHIVHSP